VLGFFLKVLVRLLAVIGLSAGFFLVIAGAALVVIGIIFVIARRSEIFVIVARVILPGVLLFPYLLVNLVNQLLPVTEGGAAALDVITGMELAPTGRPVFPCFAAVIRVYGRIVPPANLPLQGFMGVPDALVGAR